jgi:opacity protein-like surface antigen
MVRRWGFLLAGILVSAVPAAAQSDKPVRVSFGGGFTSVQGDASARLGDGWNVTVGALFRVNDIVSLQGEYGWNGMKQRTLQLPVSVTPLAAAVPADFFADANMQYGSFNVLFHAPFDGIISPYFLTGVGVYYRPVEITTSALGFTTVCDPFWYVCFPTAVPVDQVVGSRSSTDVGMNIGGGLTFRVADNLLLFVESRYHFIWGPTLDESAVPLIVGAEGVTRSANGRFLPITFGLRF